MNWDVDLKKIVVLALYVLGFLSIGWIVEKVLLIRIQKSAAKTKWKGDDIIVNSLRGISVFLALVFSCYFSFHFFDVEEKFLKTVDKVIFSLVVFSISLVIARVLVGFINTKTETAKGTHPTSSIISNVTRVIVFLVGALVVLQTLGISVTPVLTALGVGGLAVALALQDTLTNLFSGIQIIVSHQIRTGDYVKLDTGEEGYVTDITWRNTTIRALSNDLIIVPNSKLAAAIIRNYQLPDNEIAVLVDVGVAYGSDLKKVEELTIQTAKEIMQHTEGGVKDFEPFIRYNAFGDSGIKFTVIMRGQEFVSQYLIKHEFIKALHLQYEKHSIEIPFPTRTVFLKKSLDLSPVDSSVDYELKSK